MVQTNNMLLAKNTVLLYLRMFLTMLIGLYTSRVILRVLGAENYGIYDVVGGVVAILGFLNGSMSGATSRFFTVALAKGDQDYLKKVFSTAFIIHCGIAVVLFVLLETIGLWFLNNKLVIPNARMHSARIVYQISILSAMVSTTQVPYSAAIMAHEKMDIYAYIAIAQAILKLALVFVLQWIRFDKLVTYALLTFALTNLIRFFYRGYCARFFSECHFSWVWDKSIIVPMLSFSGWDLYGSMCMAASQQGRKFETNIFFGPSVNAANSLAATVRGIISGFSYNVLSAFRPQIIKSVALGDVARLSWLMTQAGKYMTSLFLLMAIPAFLDAESLMTLWLKTVPDYVIVFFRLTLVHSLFSLFCDISVIPIYGSGKIRRFSVIRGTLLLLSLLFIYLCFRVKADPCYSYYVMILVFFVLNAIVLFELKRIIPTFSVSSFIYNSLGGNVIILMVCGMIGGYIKTLLPMGFVRLLCVTMACVLIEGILVWCIVFDQSTKAKIMAWIRKRFALL